jgi:hypothetical protein
MCITVRKEDWGEGRKNEPASAVLALKVREKSILGGGGGVRRVEA